MSKDSLFGPLQIGAIQLRNRIIMAPLTRMRAGAKHLARSVHDLYFEPKYEEFRPRTIWSLSNAFTSAFKELDPIPQFRATAKLGEFLEARFSQSF